MPSPKKLNAVFFRSRSGGEPVREWLKRLPKEERKVIGEDIAYVQFKWPIGKPRVDHLRGSIWEVRTSLVLAIVLPGRYSLSKVGKCFCFMPSSRRLSKHRGKNLVWQRND